MRRIIMFCTTFCLKPDDTDNEVVDTYAWPTSFRLQVAVRRLGHRAGSKRASVVADPRRHAEAISVEELKKRYRLVGGYSERGWVDPSRCSPLEPTVGQGFFDVGTSSPCGVADLRIGRTLSAGQHTNGGWHWSIVVGLRFSLVVPSMRHRADDAVTMTAILPTITVRARGVEGSLLDSSALNHPSPNTGCPWQSQSLHRGPLFQGPRNGGPTTWDWPPGPRRPRYSSAVKVNA